MQNLKKIAKYVCIKRPRQDWELEDNATSYFSKAARSSFDAPIPPKRIQYSLQRKETNPTPQVPITPSQPTPHLQSGSDSSCTCILGIASMTSCSVITPVSGPQVQTIPYQQVLLPPISHSHQFLFPQLAPENPCVSSSQGFQQPSAPTTSVPAINAHFRQLWDQIQIKLSQLLPNDNIVP